MSIASEITRLQTSKADIKAQVNVDKEWINENTDFITSEKLDEYDSKISDMQDAYKQYIPIHTKMIAKGNTTQIGTPTPTTPKEVNNVTGKQVVTICKKNIFDKNKVIAGYRFGSDGELYATEGCNATDFIPVTPSTNYDVTWTIAWDEVVCLYDINKTFTRRLISGLNFTTEANEYFVRVDVKDGHLDTAQIAKGTSESFEPYQGKDYEINLTSRNLLDYTQFTTRTEHGVTITNNGDGTFLVNGTATSDISYPVYNTFIPMSGTWRMTGCPSGGSSSTYMLSAYVGYWGGGSPNIDTGDGTNITYTGNVKVRFYIKSGTTCNNLLFKPMLTYDTEASYNNFSPYYNIELNKIGNYQDFIRKGTGKNLFNKNDDITSGKFYTSTGDLGEDTNLFVQNSYIKVLPNTRYNFSAINNDYFRMCEYTENKTFIRRVLSNTGNTNKQYYITTPNTFYIRISCATINLDSIQIETNNNNDFTYYEPFGYKDKWYIEKNVGKVVLNGTQNIILAGSGVRRFNATYSTLGITNIKDGNSTADTTNYRKCDHFAYYTSSSTWGNYYMYGNWLVLYDTESTIADANALKTWFSNNNTKIYYVLANPTYILIENEELLNQLEAVKLQTGENNVLVSGDLPMILDLSKYIQIAENHL